MPRVIDSTMSHDSSNPGECGEGEVACSSYSINSASFLDKRQPSLCVRPTLSFPVNW